MKPIEDKKNLMKKQIPTILGLGVLVIGLIVGVIFLGTGPGVFAPRASAEATPSRIKLTNVTDSGFTVSFYTAGATPGFIKYGTDPKSTKSQTGDDRDQLSGTIGEYNLHHITVRGLKPSTSYFYVLGTGSNASFDNNGAPFTVKTAERGGAPSAAKTAYGNVLTKNGGPANGVIIYATLPGVGEMSSLVKSSGSWAIPLSNARKTDGSGYAAISDADSLTLFVQGTTPTLTSSLTVPVSQSQPVEDIIIGQSGQAITDSDNQDISVDDNLLEDNTQQAVSEVVEPIEEQQFESEEDTQFANQKSIVDENLAEESFGGIDEISVNSSSSDSAELDQTYSNTVIDLTNESEKQIVTTQNPKISGVVRPNVKVILEVNSETKIVQELTADANGNFILDIESLKETLEPGEHTATYTYTDPDTGEEVSKTITFTVDPSSDGGVGGSTVTTPYGSGNPYSIEDASASTQATSSAQATNSGTLATRSAVPATTSALPVSGSVGTTIALVLGGVFFIMAGGWSYYLATQIEVREI